MPARHLLPLGAVLSVALVVTAAGAPAAADPPAISHTVFSGAEFLDALQANGTVQLGSDIELTSDVQFPQDMEIDLNNYTLTAKNLTFVDFNGHFIDSDRDDDDSTTGLLIADASGSTKAAITTTNAGITFDAGNFELTGGTGAPGLGGNAGFAGGYAEIGAAATVTARSGTSGLSIIGPGSGVAASWNVTNYGTVIVPQRQALVAFTENYFTNRGIITGNGTVDGGTTEPWSIVNYGAITTKSIVGRVIVNNFDVSFRSSEFRSIPDEQLVRVYASTMAASNAEPPADPIAAQRVFRHWAGPDAEFSENDVVQAGSFYTGVWTDVVRGTMSPVPASIVAGSTVELKGLGYDAHDNSADQSPFITVISTGNPTDIVDGNSITFMGTGPRTIVAAIDRNGYAPQYIALDPQSTIVVGGAPTRLEVTVDDDTVTAGDSVEVGVAVYDDGDNNLASASADVQLSSNVESDNFDGTTLTMTEAGVKHVVTATYGGLSDNSTDIAVAPGALSVLSVSTALTAAAGQTKTLTAGGKDEFGNAVPVANLIITSSDPSDVLTDGEIRYQKAGSREITASFGPLTKSVVVVVTAGALESLRVVVAAKGITGTRLPISVVGADHYSNPVPTPVVTFTSSNKDAVAGGTLTLGLPGKRTITATSGGVSGTASVTVIKDTPKVSVKLPTSLKKKKKTVLTVKVAAGVSKLATTGTVRVYYSASKYVSAKLTTASKGSVKVTLPKLKKGTYTLTAKYLGSTTYLAKATTPVKRKAK